MKTAGSQGQNGPKEAAEKPVNTGNSRWKTSEDHVFPKSPEPFKIARENKSGGESGRTKPTPSLERR